MYAVSSARRLARTATAGLAGALMIGVGLLTLAVPAASAQTGDGWVRLAHLSPNTPAVDVYLYSFGNANAELVLHHVSYGTVSPYEPLAAGEYTVAMRPAGAAASTKPVLSTTVNVVAGDAYTVAGMGPAAGLRLEVFSDPLTTPPGSALVQVIQASLQQGSVTVTAGTQMLASGLQFGTATGFVQVPAGTWTVHAAGSTETATQQISLAAGTVHTLVVLDDPSALGIDDLLDAAGSTVAPASGVPAGFGGTAPRPGAPLLPWTVAGLAGLLSAAGGAVMVSRRRRPALHAR